MQASPSGLAALAQEAANSYNVYASDHVRDCRYLREVIRTEDLDLVGSADCHVGECPASRTGEIDVVGDRTGFDRLDQVERRPCVEDLRLADVLQREPHLLTV